MFTRVETPADDAVVLETLFGDDTPHALVEMFTEQER